MDEGPSPKAPLVPALLTKPARTAPVLKLAAAMRTLYVPAARLVKVYTPLAPVLVEATTALVELSRSTATPEMPVSPLSSSPLLFASLKT